MSNDTSNELAIRNLYAAYTFAVDDHDVERFTDCFTPDAEIEVSSFELVRKLIASGAAPYVNSEGRVVGIENIRALAGLVPDSVLFLHISGNVWIKNLTAESAEGQAAFVVFADDGVVEHYGRYVDRLSRCADGRWRFAERREICRYERQREGMVWQSE